MRIIIYTYTRCARSSSDARVQYNNLLLLIIDTGRTEWRFKNTNNNYCYYTQCDVYSLKLKVRGETNLLFEKKKKRLSINRTHSYREFNFFDNYLPINKLQIRIIIFLNVWIIILCKFSIIMTLIVRVMIKYYIYAWRSSNLFVSTVVFVTEHKFVYLHNT